MHTQKLCQMNEKASRAKPFNSTSSPVVRVQEQLGKRHELKIKVKDRLRTSENYA